MASGGGLKHNIDQREATALGLVGVSPPVNLTVAKACSHLVDCKKFLILFECVAPTSDGDMRCLRGEPMRKQKHHETVALALERPIPEVKMAEDGSCGQVEPQLASMRR